MKKAKYIGTIPLDYLNKMSKGWENPFYDPKFTDDYISKPEGYLRTLGSGINPTYSSMISTPSYGLPLESRPIIGGRDVLRWGGIKDPHEVDIDRYVFVLEPLGDHATIWMAPKSEPHRLREIPDLLEKLSSEDKEILEPFARD